MSSAQFNLNEVRNVFKSETFRIQLTNIIIKIIGAGILLYLIIYLFGLFTEDIITWNNVITVFEVILLFFIALLIAFFSFLGIALAYFLFFASQNVGTISAISDLTNFLNGISFYLRSFFESVLFNNISITTEGISKEGFLGSGFDPLSPIAYLLLHDTRIAYQSAFLKGVIALAFLFIILNGINFLINGNFSQVGWAFGITQFVFFLAFINKFIEPLFIDPTGIDTLLNSNMLQFALLSYFYLEYSLQTGYIDKLTKPTLGRQRRVKRQLEKLSEFRLGITQMETTGNTAEDIEKSKKESISAQQSSSSKSRSVGEVAFLLQSRQDSLFRGDPGEKEKLTGRLQRFHDALVAHDAKLDRKLGGIGKRNFNPFLVLFYVFASMAIRLVLLVLVVWLILNAALFFNFLSFPESLTNSIEFNEPESVLLVLVPVIFLVVSVALLIGYLQSFFIKAEELIVRDTEVAKLLKSGKEITDRKEGEGVRKLIDVQVAERKKTAKKEKEKKKSKKKSKKKGLDKAK